MIIERTKALEYKATELIKEYAQVYQKIYQKPLDLQYAYISILKKVKYFSKERYGELLNIIRNFYCRYLEAITLTRISGRNYCRIVTKNAGCFFQRKQQRNN
ncbi:hypothetical protein [Spiroplasma endosymbiont of Poecilobothrus nobilitatus]|uniref:hypothetical protein n=1 Tax=Spiroplasma endosymbiont of Poecilobothrus nobilitatus TaxID=1209220 RepID=UPI00313D09F0